MPLSKTPLDYLILGAAGSGRREILADIIEGGLAPGDRSVVLLSGDEAPSPADGKLGAVAAWRLVALPVHHGPRPDPSDEPPEPLHVIEAEPPEEATHLFFVTDGRRNPVDQIEAFKAWLAGRNVELAHILCVVNCHLAEQHPKLAHWYDACIHFSDIVLLTRREGVANKWVSDFQARYEEQFYPCLFEIVKGGRVRNPALILEPRALRISHAFDPEPEWIFRDAEGEVVDEDEVTEDDEEEVTATQAVDPYFVRRIGGRREKEVPDIGRFLDGAR